MGVKRDEYNWLDDAFDDKKAREENVGGEILAFVW